MPYVRGYNNSGRGYMWKTTLPDYYPTEPVKETQSDDSEELNDD